MSTLVIVESPTKARTIRNFLPQGYRVEASMGHVRDLPDSASDIPAEYKALPWAKLGVNVENDFEPLYVVPKDKKKIVRELKEALKGVTELILATDEDREGESISWHLLQLLNPKVPTKRMVFHEITAEAIRAALNECREVDEQLVRAQETRRLLDRLVGYTLSPLLWKKLKPRLSAGRVQSVAVRLLVERERQRLAFRSGTYWDLKAALFAPDSVFPAQLVSLNGQNVASGEDFDSRTGQLAAGKNVVLLDETTAQALADRLLTAPWVVEKLERRPKTQKPSPPFTTSTLQQEANRKLRLSARDTMRIAQSLYEQGYITYMRTDSVHLSQQAIAAARQCAEQMYGPEYLSPKPRQYTTKAKGAQEAHEAIRPAGETFRTLQETGLMGREGQVYDLIWKRTVACQMADARQTLITARIQAEEAMFRASGKQIDFPGFFRAYVEGSDDPEAALESREVILPAMAPGDRLTCRGIESLKHETQPPARYTEASLVKTLESEGIGRPSTYASIIGTICDPTRGYATAVHNALVPTFTAFAVTSLLEEHFPNLVDVGFTSRMEQTLDDISTGQANWLSYLREFYLGESGLENQVKTREHEIDPDVARTLELAPAPAVRVKIGKFGPYIQQGEGDRAVSASLPQDLTPAELAIDTIETLLKQKLEGPDQVGVHPASGEPIFLLVGQYGPYVQMGNATEENPKPRRASLPKGTSPEDLTLDLAVKLLELPRGLGVHPETGGKIEANQGRFGPYVMLDRGKEGKDYRSLKGEDDPYTITLERALVLLAQPKASRRGATPLRTLGAHGAAEIELYSGKYGPYLKYGKTNLSLPKEVSPENITLEQAIALLASKEVVPIAEAPTAKAKGNTKGSPKATPDKGTAKKSPTATRTTKTKTTSRSRSKAAPASNSP
ncbi:MAG: type I DNA topoisomerase [Oscillatoriales cyanobacterium SM2_1_8]|nr:type I DNA topoisomerase [Oscillatoriales cyanobacterium SM2_1_8]